jgi:hypothetical protein
MGSSGSGSFSDYSKNKPKSPEEGNGGSSGIDKCTLAFAASLQEVARCFFFMNTGILPPINTPVRLTFNGVRIVAETFKGEEIGYLPTQYNYLKNCMDAGFSYSGVVRNEGITPAPTVLVDIQPST